MTALAQGIVSFARALSRSLIRRDHAQASNLRLHGFRARARELSERLRDATRNDAKINEAPERYRAYAVASTPSPSADGPFARARLRFTLRWTAAVAVSIDLRATFLCGDRIVAGSTREITCLDAATGIPLRRRSAPARSPSMTPQGLGRLDAEGTLRFHNLGDGEVLWSTRLAPRVGTTASGVVVSRTWTAAAVDRQRRSRHLAAIDLHAGEVRWRFKARRGGMFRVRRAGKLVVLASSDSTLTALDVQTGELVWRCCNRLRFGLPVVSDHDSLFAVAGGGAMIGGTGRRSAPPYRPLVRCAALASVDLPDAIPPWARRSSPRTRCLWQAMVAVDSGSPDSTARRGLYGLIGSYALQQRQH